MFGCLLRGYTIYTFLASVAPVTEFCQVQNSVCVLQVLRSAIGSVTAWHSSSGREPNCSIEHTGCHLYSAGRPSRWALAHILVLVLFWLFQKLPSVFLTLLVRHQEERPACKNEWFGAGVVSNVQVIGIWPCWCHCHPIIPCFIKVQIDLTFMVPAYPGCPQKEAIKWSLILPKTKMPIAWWNTATTHNNNNRFMAVCPGLPGWAGTRRNTHPPTILIIIQSLSASSIYHDPSSNYVLGNLFAQPLATSSLVYLLVWSPPPHIPYISSPNQCLLFATHAHTIATSFAVVSIFISSIPSLSLNSLLGTLSFTLSFTLTLHIHLTILISACWSATSFSFLTGQEILQEWKIC